VLLFVVIVVPGLIAPPGIGAFRAETSVVISVNMIRPPIVSLWYHANAFEGALHGNCLSIIWPHGSAFSPSLAFRKN
jgi:hypothetical protein